MRPFDGKTGQGEFTMKLRFKPKDLRSSAKPCDRSRKGYGNCLSVVWTERAAMTDCSLVL
jgi:hypothetical protein